MLNTTIEVSNRGPLHKGNRKLSARMATASIRRTERIAPNLAKAADELFAANLRREKAAKMPPVDPSSVLPDAPPV